MGSHGVRNLAFSSSFLPSWWHSQQDHLCMVVRKATGRPRILSPLVTSASEENISFMVVASVESPAESKRSPLELGNGQVPRARETQVLLECRFSGPSEMPPPLLYLFRKRYQNTKRGEQVFPPDVSAHS